MRDGVGAAFGEHGTGGAEKAPLPGRAGGRAVGWSGGCVSGPSTGDVTPDYLPGGGATGLPVYDAAYPSTYNG